MNNDKVKAILWGLVMGVLALWIYDRWGKRALNALVGSPAPRGDVRIAVAAPAGGEFPPGYGGGADCGRSCRC
jgi:hypothetical protein